MAAGFRQHRWRWLWTAVLLAAALCFVFWARLRGEENRFDWALFVATLTRLHWGWLSLSVLVAISTYWGRALRWAELMRPVRPNPSLWNLFSATAVGFTALVLLGRPGEFVRPYLISLKEKVPLSSQWAAWVLERIYDLFMVLILAGIALSQVSASQVSVGPTIAWVLRVGGWALFVASVICATVFLMLANFSEKMRLRLLGALGFLRQRHFQKAERIVNAFLKGIEGTKDLRSSLILLGYSILEWSLIVFCCLCITKAFGAAVPFRIIDVIVFLGFVAFGSVIQLPGIGGGVQVASIIVLTELYHIPLETATSFSLVMWFITILVIVPVGLALAVHEGLNWTMLRAAEEEIPQ